MMQEGWAWRRAGRVERKNGFHVLSNIPNQKQKESEM